MIEQGLVQLVQGNADVAALAVNGGGWLATLPKGQTLPSWTYQVISAIPALTLTTVTGLQPSRWQIDCYGMEAADVVNLSKAINGALHGFRGTLADPDNTYVDSAFRSDLHDPEYDPASRTWRRVIEFEIHYVSQF